MRLPAAAISEVETVGTLLHVLEQAHCDACSAPYAIAKPVLSNAPATVEARPLGEAPDWCTERHFDRLHLTVPEIDAQSPVAMSYRDFAEAARNAAQGLMERDIAPGDRIALLLPTVAIGLRQFQFDNFARHLSAIPLILGPPSAQAAGRQGLRSRVFPAAEIEKARRNQQTA